MANRYHDKLQMLHTTAATRNEVGDLVAGRSEWVDVTECRCEPSGGGKAVSTTNAKATDLISEIFFPANAPSVPINAHIRVLGNDGTELVAGHVTRYKRYQHYGKIWL